MAEQELYQYVRSAVNSLVEPEDDDYIDPLSIELERKIVVWITYGGPNVWLEIPIEHGNAVMHGSWGSNRVQYTLTHDEESTILEALGIHDIEEYARCMGLN